MTPRPPVVPNNATSAVGDNVTRIQIIDASGNILSTFTTSENLAQVGGTNVDTNSGTKSAGTLRVVLATDQPALTNPLDVNNKQIAGTTMDTNSGSKSAGTQRVVIATDQVQLTNALKVDASATTQPVSGAVNLIPATSGGMLINRLLSANTTNATSAKGSAGQVYGWYLFNANGAARYLKLYNKATAPTVGSDTPVMTIPIPAGAAANVEFTNGITFATGVAYALTTGIADADTGAVALNDIVVNLLYK